MKKLVTILIVSVIATLLIVGSYKYFLTSSEITVRVADINKGTYVSLCIVGKDEKAGCDEYTNVDDMWFWKFDSGKLRSRLSLAEKDNKEITVKVQGLRVNVLSWRKNIVGIVD